MSAQNVNKIDHGLLYSLKDRVFRVTVTDEETGEVLYSDKSFGGQLCTVESFQILKGELTIEGNQQHLMWGPPAVVVHANIQSRDRLQEIMQESESFRNAALGAFNRL